MNSDVTSKDNFKWRFIFDSFHDHNNVLVGFLFQNADTFSKFEQVLQVGNMSMLELDR